MHDASDGSCKKGKEKVRIFIYFFENLVDLLKLLVATAYVDCTACAPCKQLCVEYTNFARKSNYCVRIVRLLRVSDLLRTYTTCAHKTYIVRTSRLERTSRIHTQ